MVIGLGLPFGWAPAIGCPAVSLLDNCFVARAQAPTQAQITIYPADASAFPQISTFMDVFDATGRFVSGLKPEQVTITEDGKTVPVAALNEMVVPLQLTVAINPSPFMGLHDKQGIPWFSGITQALTAWAQSLPANTPDDMSLVSITGPIIAHASAKDWLVSLSAFQPDFHSTTPNLQSLQSALQTVAIQPPRVGMKRAVLFITPHMDDPNIEATIQPLINLAIQTRVRVFVWFTDTDLYTSTESAAAFNTLAVQTGGAFFAATGLQPYPDPETYFAPLRRLYALQYDSAIATGGQHAFNVSVQGEQGSIKSPDQPFTVDLQPPNPILVSPPLEIVRHPPDDDPYNEKVLLPDKQALSIIMEFPDGHKRSVVRTALYVDGKVAAENTAPPFDAFTWDLSGYKESGEHKIAVEAVDSLNLSKSSMEIPVTVTVVQAPHGLSAIFSRYSEYITIGSVGLAGLALVLVLFLARFRMVFARARTARQEQADPLTQPISTRHEATVAAVEKKAKRRRTKAASPPPQPPAPTAVLRRLVADPLAAPGQTFKPAPGSPIPLAEKEITFGTDPVQSSYVLDDPSLAPRHARITRTDSGHFFVVDAGTVAGTWVNFEPVGREQHLLQHGDVLHFGQLIFRFELANPPVPPEPRVTKENPEA
jgi:hypothetical protein